MRDVTKALMGLGGALLLIGAAPPEPASSDDPHLDLEQVDGAKAMATVKGWNAKTLDALEKQSGFADYQSRALALLSDDRKIAEPDRIIGDRVLNLWQDAAHPRGLWRVSPLDAFAAGKPEWRTLIDVAALGKTEGRRWVFKGADCRAPAYDRCIVALSDGGGDAVVRREFDMGKGAFVAHGFVVPQGKSETAWAGPDALYVATDFGPGTTTTSGYARIVKLWRRGTPLSSAKTLLEGEASDVSVSASVSVDGDTMWPMLRRGVDFYHTKVWHVAPDGRLVPSPLPLDADIDDILDGRAIATLKSAWQDHPAGSIVAYSIPDVLAGKTPTIETVFEPNAHQAVEDVSASKSIVWVKLLDDVSGRLTALRRDADGRWSGTATALPDKSTIHLNAVAGTQDVAFATVEGMLTPPTLFRIVPGAAPTPIQSLPARFDASKMKVEQHFATSKDGTKVPYFLVRRIDSTGPVPAYIHAYGGFELAQTPSYLVNEPYRSGPAALYWVEEGNAYVLANLRGGGEYGPAWHDAALREKRQNAYDDLHAVVQDLIATGVTQKKRIAVSGRSNGGLLVSVAMTQRPDLYGAIVMGSPLADMKRYSHLLAGASWMGEYGDPDKPADWAFISRYSPYQNLKAGVKYPVPFIYTSTRDDRVHPGHARKFAARLQDYRDPFFYYEAIEGGHAAGVEPKEDALRAALVTVYLNLELPAKMPAKMNAR
ncbi:MAG: family peptidase [Sphingomonas bacterium]|nr:family peptidase [Sphingomonas bacterium]